MLLDTNANPCRIEQEKTIHTLQSCFPWIVHHGRSLKFAWGSGHSGHAAATHAQVYLKPANTILSTAKLDRMRYYTP